MIVCQDHWNYQILIKAYGVTNYMDPLECNNLNPDEYNLIVMQLNIQSILVHQSKLKQLLQILEERNSKVDAILLCGTYLMKFTEKLVNIPGYTLISNSRINQKVEE